MKRHCAQDRKSREQGFTLIEVLIAVVILTVGLLAVGTMQISAIRGNFMSGNTSTALTLASDKMEDLLNQNYSSVVTGADSAGDLHSRSWTVTEETSPLRKNVVVTVTWDKNKHHVSIASIKRP